MTYVCNYSNDYGSVDGVETVTYTLPDGSTVVSSVRARRGTLTHSDLQNGAVFGVMPGDVPFVLWAGTLSGNVPAQGGVITADSVGYTVLSVATRGDGAQYRVIARKQV